MLDPRWSRRQRSDPERHVAEPHDEQHIKVALCGLPAFVADVVAELVSDDPQVRIVANLDPGGNLWSDFERSTADLLICSFGAPEMHALWKTSLAHRPPYAVLNLAGDHRSGQLYALYPEQATVEELTGASLLETLAAHMRSLLRADDP
jgi:hypothetical protein